MRLKQEGIVLRRKFWMRILTKDVSDIRSSRYFSTRIIEEKKGLTRSGVYLNNEYLLHHGHL